MKKAPFNLPAAGALGEQLTLIDPPPFCPTLPPKNSKADLALHDLAQGPVTQLEWLARGLGWRLAAAVKELDYLGWEPVSVLVERAGWPKPIALYTLTAEAKQAAAQLRRAAL